MCEEEWHVQILCSFKTISDNALLPFCYCLQPRYKFQFCHLGQCTCWNVTISVSISTIATISEQAPFKIHAFFPFFLMLLFYLLPPTNKKMTVTAGEGLSVFLASFVNVKWEKEEEEKKQTKNNNNKQTKQNKTKTNKPITLHCWKQCY